MTTPLARLIEVDTMLVYITTHYGTTLRRLNEAQPGYPARTPGSGEPGGGKGFTAGSTVERQAGKRTPEQTDLEDAHALPALIARTVNELADCAQLAPVGISDGPRLALRRLVWARWLLHRMIAHDHPAPSRPLGALHRHCVELDAICRRWGSPLHTPKRQSELIPQDLTGMWCTSCLRIGDKNPRHRGDRCGWCYTFQRTQGFIVPTDLLEKHNRGLTVFDRDIEPHRKAWRERQKQRKRKKAG